MSTEYGPGVSAVILAGGHSRRMGTNKLLLPLGNDTVLGVLLHRLRKVFAEIIVVTNEPHTLQAFGVTLVSDILKGEGKSPLIGIHAGLVHVSYERAFVVAGDMPFVCPKLARYLSHQSRGYDVTIPMEGRHHQPLLAVYSKTCIRPIAERVQAGDYRITSFFKEVAVQYVEEEKVRALDPELDSYFNINTPADYVSAKRKIHEAVP